jgi:hypothetical protein
MRLISDTPEKIFVRSNHLNDEGKHLPENACRFASNNTRFFDREKLGRKARANLIDRKKSRLFSEN